MKKVIFSTLLIGGGLFGQAQTAETVSMEQGYAKNQWYSLENGVVSTADANNWDLAFQIGGLADASIRINEGNGVMLYLYGDINDWSTIDTAGMNWNPLYNSGTSWRDGATNQVKDKSNPFDYGWGVYEPSTHEVNGQFAFILQLNDSTFKKLKVEKLSDMGSVYHFTLADLDGSNEVQQTIDKDDYTEKSFVYFSATDNQVLNREEVKESEWDFLFTKYMDSTENPMSPGVIELHSVTGLLSNPKTEVAQIDGVDVANFSDWWGADYAKEINTIGYDWKEFNMTTFQYEITSDRVYFVKTRAGDVWKVVMTGFGGSATGDFEFTKEKMSTASLNEFGKEEAEVIVYPNPATTNVSLVLNNLASSKVQVEITNMAGQVVYSQNMVGNTNFEIKNIPVSSYGSGVYIINISSENQRISRKLVIK